jgi:2-methylisocitrate lyase-like PEP mutase family enzyme
MNAARKQFRRALSEPGVLTIPAAYDGFSALLTARAGFPAVYLTGNGMSGSVLGLPDVGLMTLTEVANVARNVAAAVEAPVIVDADTGYGNAVNVYHTVKTLESAGAAAIQLEDQVNPKRCGHMPGKREVVGFEEAVGKIAAAVAARTDPDFAIIARTDATSAHGLEEAIRRANAFLAAGADIAFVECTGTREQLEAIGRDVHGPSVVNQDEAGESAKFSTAELAAFGIKLAIYPGVLRYSACYAMQWALDILKQDGNTARARERMVSFGEYNDILGIEAVKEIEARFMRSGGVPSPVG